MDIFCSGNITGIEFAKFFSESIGLDHDHILTMFKVLDQHKQGFITFQDFVEVLNMLLHGTDLHKKLGI